MTGWILAKDTLMFFKKVCKEEKMGRKKGLVIDPEQMFRDLVADHGMNIRERLEVSNSTISKYKRLLKDRMRCDLQGKGLSTLEIESQINKVLFGEGVRMVTVEV
jgi:hypothetical protein